MRSRAKWKSARFDAVVDAYLASDKFAELREGTKENWRRQLIFAARIIGNTPVDEIRPAVVQVFLDGLAQWPGKQENSLKALKAVEKWAIVRDLLPRPIALGVEISGSHGGHIPWTEDQVSLAEMHARSDLGRVVILAANTGQRGSDLVRMGWGDIETIQGRAGINVRQVKTGVEVWCPINEALARAMTTWERRPGPFLLQRNGDPWTRHKLSDTWHYELRTNPKLRELRDAGLVLHGLRGHACVRLYRAGHTTREVAVLVGMSLNVVEQYCRLSVQKDNALAAVIRLETGQNKSRFSNAS